MDKMIEAGSYMFLGCALLVFVVVLLAIVNLTVDRIISFLGVHKAIIEYICNRKEFTAWLKENKRKHE